MPFEGFKTKIHWILFFHSHFHQNATNLCDLHCDTEFSKSNSPSILHLFSGHFVILSPSTTTTTTTIARAKTHQSASACNAHTYTVKSVVMIFYLPGGYNSHTMCQALFYHRRRCHCCCWKHCKINSNQNY